MLIPANLNILNSREIFSTVLVTLITMALIALTQPQDALIFMTLNIPTVLAYQVVLIQEEMNGMMAHISATLLALLDISTLKKTPA